MNEEASQGESYMYSESDTMSTSNDIGSYDSGNEEFDDEFDEEFDDEFDEEFDEEFADGESIDDDDDDESPVTKLNFCAAEKVDQKMEDEIRETAGLLNVPPSAAHVLLRNYKWNQQELVSNFFDKQTSIMESCGVQASCSILNKKKIAVNGPMAQCEICCEDVPPDGYFSLGCNHEYCKECWKRHIETEIKKGPNVCLSSTCMHSDCQEVITEDAVKCLTPELLPKFRDFQLRSYIKLNKLMRWCPGAGCNRIAVCTKLAAASTKFGSVRCACNTEFCLECGEPTHGPVNCSMLKQWKKKCMDESESVSWIFVNTKQCPNPDCSVHIEKNNGCNHMTCKMCKHEFCWICLADWKGHKSCQKIKTENKQVIAKEVDRYIHCYNHYDAQSKSQEAAEQQLKELDRQAAAGAFSKVANCSHNELLRDALPLLVECRNILKFTYVGLFYSNMSEGERDLFGFQRDHLSAVTEKLSEITENLDKYNISDFRRQVDVVDRIVNHYKNNIIFS